MNINDITTGPLRSVAQIIDLEESLGPSDGIDRRWAFRGQPREFAILTPSFQRQFTSQSFATAEIIERRLIDDFRNHYSRMQYRSPGMPIPESIGSDFDLRCLSVMQHYEIPTRLLDWTSKYWIAVYFACASDPAENAELWFYDRQIFDAQRVEHPELWSLINPSEKPAPEPRLLEGRAESLIVELDPQLTPRMKEQSAHHTISANVFSDHAPLLFALEQSISKGNDVSQKLRRFVIDGACKGKALQFLAEYKSITASTVFPDVVGLGRFLRWQFDSLRTMLL
jgi:hypothetical protein